MRAQVGVVVPFPSNDLTPMRTWSSSSAHDLRETPLRIRRACALLLQGHEYAQQLGRNAWDFALEISALRELGVTNNDLRWLACHGFVEHAREITHLGDTQREFRPIGRLNFAKRSCFVLSASGVDLAERLAITYPLPRQGERGDESGRRASPHPVWDCDRREFRVGNEVVKRFRLPSPNQEMILMAFEEEGWPPRIDDPLPPSADSEPKQRLRDTIKSLNRNHKAARARFKGDGTGQGVLWEFVAGPPGEPGE